MSGAAPPAPPSSPGVLARRSDACCALYLRYSPPIAKPIGCTAPGEAKPRSPEMIARACASEVRLVVELFSVRKSAIEGVIEPSGPNRLMGTQSALPLWQVTPSFDSDASRKRDCSVYPLIVWIFSDSPYEPSMFQSIESVMPPRAPTR